MVRVRRLVVGAVLASVTMMPAVAGAAGTSYTGSGPTPAPGVGSITLPVISVHVISSAASLSFTRTPLGRLAVATPKGLLARSQQLVIGNAKKLASSPRANLTVLGAYSVGVVNAAGKNLVNLSKFFTVVVDSGALAPGDQVFIFVGGKWVPAPHYTVVNGRMVLHLKGSVSFEITRTK